MTYYIVKDLSGLYRACRNMPIKRKCYWYPINEYYFNISNSLGNQLFDITFDSEPQVWEINFSGNDNYYLSCDLNGIGHISRDIPEYCSIFSKQFNCENKFWKFGKEFISIPKEFMNILFNINCLSYSEIKINFTKK